MDGVDDVGQSNPESGFFRLWFFSPRGPSPFDVLYLP